MFCVSKWFVVLPIALRAALSDPQSILPLTEEGVKQYIEQIQENVEQTVHELSLIPNEARTFENTLLPWDLCSQKLLADLGVLAYVAEREGPSQIAAAGAMSALQGFLFHFLRNGPLYPSFIAYAKKALNENASPYVCYEIDCLLKSCATIKESLSEEEQNTLRELDVLSEKKLREPFIYLKGEASDKSLEKEEDCSIFTLNTCLIPGGLSFLQGMRPCEERISSLGEKILQVDADVVCLQEVFGEETARALYNILKKKYAHFYVAIGPRPLGFSLDMVGISSGLFVASKYPCEKPEFTLFSVVGFPVNYGFFDFTLKSKDSSFGHIYTTHLQALNYEQFDRIRAMQLEQILQKMHSDSQEDNMPLFLCGDLNIPLGSEEEGEYLVQSHFYDAYSGAIEEVTEENRTCTDYFAAAALFPEMPSGEIDPNFQILDYALLFKGNASFQHCQMNTTLVPMNDLNKPEQAATDHHGLLTKLRLQKMQEKTPKYLYKILSTDAWEASQKLKELKLSKEDEKFIHFSTEDQLERILAKYWEGKSYVVLKVEVAKLPGNMQFESNPGGSSKYYHLYNGSIPLNTVTLDRGQSCIGER